MKIRRAQKKDMEKINDLLYQVAAIHHEGRPDLFKPASRKYEDDELLAIIENDETPIFVAADEDDLVEGYAFCVFERTAHSHAMTDITTLYIDDLCVDAACRGKHIGKSLYEYVLDFAKKEGCYNVTLNVWAANTAAIRFYEKCGLKPQKIGMEKIL